MPDTAAPTRRPGLSRSRLDDPPGGPEKRTPQADRVVWLVIATVCAGGLNYAYAIVLTHGLSTAAYAVFAGGQSLLLIKGIVGTGGVPWVLARVIGATPDDEAAVRRAVSFCFWVNVWSGVALAVVLGAVAASFAPSCDVCLIAATTLLLSVGSTGSGYLQGHRRTNLLAVVNIGEVVVKVVAGLLLVLGLGAGSAGALAGPLVGSLVPFATLPFYARMIARPTLTRDNSDLWRSAGRISVLQALVGVLSLSDSVVVAALASTRAGAAPYQVASTLGRVPLYLSNAVSTAVFPQLSRPGAARAFAAATRSYVLPAAVFAWALATLPASLAHLVFPDSYDAVTRWLPYTAALGFCVGTFNLLVTGVQSRDRVGGFVAGLSAWVALTVAGMIVGGEADGVTGLAAVAVTSAVFGCLILAADPLARPALAEAAGGLARRPVATGVAAALAVVMLGVSSPALWIPVTLVAGGLAGRAGLGQGRAR